MNRQQVVGIGSLSLIATIGIIGMGWFGIFLMASLALGAIVLTYNGFLGPLTGVLAVWLAGLMTVVSGAPMWWQIAPLLLGIAFVLAGNQAPFDVLSWMSYIIGTTILIALIGLFIGQKYSVNVNRVLESVNAPESWKFAAPAMELKTGNWEIVTPNSGKAGLSVSVNVKSKKTARITYEWSSSGTSGRTVMRARVSSRNLTGDFRTSAAGNVSGGSGQFQLKKSSPGCFRGIFTTNGRKANVALRQAGKTHCQR
ncbi:MAG: hypothetical protein BRC25_03390 [Parcubacteria group bacterium SW_6_46_9]|nr:MAG: hypothetical protein BRC25_03390 [Parcubacteria group bacterium SW_6_46_9]